MFPRSSETEIFISNSWLGMQRLKSRLIHANGGVLTSLEPWTVVGSTVIFPFNAFYPQVNRSKQGSWFPYPFCWKWTVWSFCVPRAGDGVHSPLSGEQNLILHIDSAAVPRHWWGFLLGLSVQRSKHCKHLSLFILFFFFFFHGLQNTAMKRHVPYRTNRHFYQSSLKNWNENVLGLAKCKKLTPFTEPHHHQFCVFHQAELQSNLDKLMFI